MIAVNGVTMVTAAGGGGGGGGGAWGGGGEGGEAGETPADGSSGRGPGSGGGGHGGSASSGEGLAGGIGSGCTSIDNDGGGGGGGGGAVGGEGGHGGGGGGGGGGAGSSPLSSDVLNGSVNAAPSQADGQITISFVQAPEWTSDSPPTQVAFGSTFSYRFQATGSPAPTYSVQGTVPPGFTLDPNTGVATYFVTAPTPLSFEVVATNPVGSVSTGPLVVTVGPGAPIWTDASPAGTVFVGETFSHRFHAVGLPVPTYSIEPVGTDPIPDGFDIDPATGVVTYDTATPEFFFYQVVASNSTGSVRTQPLPLQVISDPPTWTSDSPPTQIPFGSSFSYQFQASGTPAPTYSIHGSVPPGFTIDSATGVVTYDVSYVNSFTYTVTATNPSGSTTTRTIDFFVQLGDESLPPSQPEQVQTRVDPKPADDSTVRANALASTGAQPVTLTALFASILLLAGISLSLATKSRHARLTSDRN